MARLNVNWHGHRRGTLVYAAEADRAVEAGVAAPEKVKAARVIDTTPSPAAPAKRARKRA